MIPKSNATATTTTQSTEELTLFERSHGDNTSLSNEDGLKSDNSKAKEIEIELVEMDPGVRMSVVPAQQAKIIQIPPRYMRSPGVHGAELE